jgi:hypothetical protein
MVAVFHLTWALMVVAGFRLQASLVAHALVREVAAGTSDPLVLSTLGKAYGKEVGMPRKAVITVTVGEEDAGAGLGSMLTGMFAGTRVNITAWMPAPGSLRLVFPLGLRTKSSASVVSDPWKSPMTRFKRMLGGGGEPDK